MNVDLVQNRKWLFWFSGLTVVIAAVMLAIPPSLQRGIDFTSGTETLLRFEKAVDEAQLRAAYADLGHPEARIQSTGGSQYLVRTKELQVPPGSFTQPVAPAQNDVRPVGPTEVPVLGTVKLGAPGASGAVTLRQPGANNDTCKLGDPAGDAPAGAEAQVIGINSTCPDGETYRVTAGNVAGYIAKKDTTDFVSSQPVEPPKDQGERTVIEKQLRERFGNFEVLEFSSVNPTVADQAAKNAGVAVVIAALFILIYLAFAFHGVPSPLRYGVCAILALIHDVVITLGFLSFFGKVFGTEVNLMVVTALLTVIGFSVHDSIVVFDRIRENIRTSPHLPLHENVNGALLQTMARSLNTSITLLITVAAMLALGGSTIQSFLLVILVGVTAGVYSSIGVAAQLLVSWEEGDFGRLAFWRRRRRLEQAS